jgi:hypothetical protein
MPANAGIHDFSKTVGKRFFFEKKKAKNFRSWGIGRGRADRRKLRKSI